VSAAVGTGVTHFVGTAKHPAPSGRQCFNQNLVIGGVLMLLIGITALLPRVVETVVVRLGKGPLSWRLAVRRLRQLRNQALTSGGDVQLEYQAPREGTLRRAPGTDQAWTGYQGEQSRCCPSQCTRASASVARCSANGTAVRRQSVFISDILKDVGFERLGMPEREGREPLDADQRGEHSRSSTATGCSSAPYIGTLPSTGSYAELLDKPAEKPAVPDRHATVLDGSAWTRLGGVWRRRPRCPTTSRRRWSREC
jgi:hypothetical protein